jgi:hypothetical protein
MSALSVPTRTVRRVATPFHSFVSTGGVRSTSCCSKIVLAAIALGSVPAAFGATRESLGSLEIPYATITTA